MIVPNGCGIRPERKVVRTILEVRQFAQGNNLPSPAGSPRSSLLSVENSNVKFSATLPMLLLLKSHHVALDGEISSR